MKSAFLIPFGLVTVIFISAHVSDRIYGLNWDGMLIHKEYVMALEGGWNPSKDPYFEKGLENVPDWESDFIEEKLRWGGYNVRFGYIWQSVLAKAVGSNEACKGINILFYILPFFASLLLFRNFGLDTWRQLLLSLVVALNPTCIIQYFSYWEDIHFACFSVTSILLALNLCLVRNRNSFFIFALSLILLIGSKRSGVAFAFALIPATVLSYFITGNRMKVKHLVISTLSLLAGLAIVLLVGKVFGLWKTHGWLPFKLDYLLSLSSLEYYFGESFAARFPRLTSVAGAVQAFLSAISPASMEPDDVSFRFPFSFRKEEIAVYSHIFTGPWFGGNGPFFGEAIALSLIGRFGCKFKWNKKELLCLLGVFFILAILYVMPAYYSRWIPFIWLFPVLLFLSISSGERDKGRSLPSFSILKVGYGNKIWRWICAMSVPVMLLNASLLLILNVSGHMNASAIVNEQLEFIDEYLEHPIKVQFNNFPSNRDWFERKSVSFELVDALNERVPVLCISRTDTLIDLSHFDFNQSLMIGGKEWDTIYDWADSINRRSGYRSNWASWIRPAISG
ncbi:MAG: hypothetical protein MI748_06200 [Opitutales bacterium]|nr:hypothetical protein [Opitutales bacterium]